MRAKISLVLILAVCISLSTGCVSRGLKEGLYAVTGSSGHYILLTGRESQCEQLTRRYGTVQVGSIANDIGPVCPSLFISELPPSIQAQLQYRNDSDKEDNIPFFRGPKDNKLLISGSVIHYDTGKLLDQIVGPMEEAICRLQIRDAKSNDLLAEANFVSRAKSSVRKGPEELA